MKRERDWLPRGSKHHNSKITEEDAEMILILIQERKKLIEQASSLTHAAIAEKFGIHKQTVCDISMGKSWRHVQGAA
jgi:hypothetical protein